jgi:hypothetical protein
MGSVLPPGREASQQEWSGLIYIPFSVKDSEILAKGAKS